MGPFISTDFGPFKVRSWNETCITNHLYIVCVDIAVIGAIHSGLGSKRALWLPPEYRAAYLAVKNEAVALGHASVYVYI